MKNNYHFVYNKRVSDFLTKEGIKFITVAKDLKTNRVFSLYEVTSELQRALDKYQKNKA
ncbi:DUF5659 domain-containing protein [Virgibacillus natechei]